MLMRHERQRAGVKTMRDDDELCERRKDERAPLRHFRYCHYFRQRKYFRQKYRLPIAVMS